MYSNEKFVRSKGVKVSVNWYKQEALRIIENEEGKAPATLIHEFAFKPHERSTRRLFDKFKSLVEELMNRDRSSV